MSGCLPSWRGCDFFTIKIDFLIYIYIYNLKMEEKEECLICYDYDGEMYELECSHKFHIECIISWFRSGKTECPYCRKMPIKEEIIYPDEDEIVSEFNNISVDNNTNFIDYKKILNDYFKKKTNEKNKFIEYKKQNKIIKKEMVKIKKDIKKEIDELLEKKLEELPEDYKKNITKIKRFCNKCVKDINNDVVNNPNVDNNNGFIAKWLVNRMIYRRMGMRYYNKRSIYIKARHSILFKN
jgi:hypothetical protein